MAHTPATGRPSIFRGKDGGKRVQGVITKRGASCFEHARRWLARQAKLETHQVSDADVIEHLARGESETLRYMARSTR